MSCCENNGPGYASPMEAYRNGPREKLIYVTCPRYDSDKPDYLATVDVDRTSANYSQVVHRLKMPYAKDELHHTGWNCCSSCYGVVGAKRTHLMMPSLNSSRVYAIDVSDERAPKIDTVIEPSQLLEHDATFPHTTHCLADGNVMISTLGDAEGNAKGSFVLIDSKTFEVKGTWGDKMVEWNYDFWYQPRRNVMISTAWGTPKYIKQGFHLEHVQKGYYGDKLFVWNWDEKKLQQTIHLPKTSGSMPLEVRFLHEPTKNHAFIGCALGSTVFHCYENEKTGMYEVSATAEIPSKKVEGWLLSEMPALITDILLSMDDKFMYVSCWAHGDVRQYDISDPNNVKLVGQLFLGGLILSDGPVKVTHDEELKQQPSPVYVKGRRLDGAPQMLQLSLDGKRLYVTTSLCSWWDIQFYPEQVKNGALMLQVDCDIESGGLKLNKDFLVDFGKEPDGPCLAHEMRYPGGDCSSDIWL